MIHIASPMIGKEEIRAAVSVLKSGMLTQGGNVSRFEEEFSRFIGTKYGIACSSGTSAIAIGLESLGISEGDEVITTPFTFIASANSILYNNARPVFAEIDGKPFNIDIESIKQKLPDKTRAVMVVHLYGQPCDMKPVKELCEEKGLLPVGVTHG